MSFLPEKLLAILAVLFAAVLVFWVGATIYTNNQPDLIPTGDGYGYYIYQHPDGYYVLTIDGRIGAVSVYDITGKEVFNTSVNPYDFRKEGATPNSHAAGCGRYHVPNGFVFQSNTSPAYMIDGATQYNLQVKDAPGASPGGWMYCDSDGFCEVRP